MYQLVAGKRRRQRVKPQGASAHRIAMSKVTGFPAIRTNESAVCELCGGMIATTNGGLHTGL